MKGNTMNLKIGDGATIIHYTDRDACTIIDISKSGRVATIQKDKAILLNDANSGAHDSLKVEPGGFSAHVSGEQRYKITPNSDEKKFKVSLRKNGEWRIIKDNTLVHMGVRNHYYDFNF